MRRPAVPDLAWTALLTFVVLGPLLTGGGYWLFGDMVFVPHQPWKPAWLGLDGGLARAVPMDALVSVLTHVVPGWAVQRLFLVGAFLAGGLGTARLVAGHGTAARLAAVTLVLWNPWVLERLLIGQWAILAGYLLLPWVAVAALALRRDVRAGWPALALALVASAVCSPSSGLTAAVVAAALGLRRRRSHVLVVGALAAVANAPWVVPSLLGSGRVGAAGVFEAFAARAESAAGTLPSLFSLGGIWKTSVVPAERTSAVVVLLSCLLTVAALAGLRHSLRWREDGVARRLGGLAAGAFLLAALPTLPGGTGLLEQASDAVGPLAILRDSHRYLAPAVLLLAVGVAGATEWARRQVRPGREAMAAVVGLLVAAPLLLLPSLAWGNLGSLPRTTYPDDWDAVAARVLEDAGGSQDRTVVLPWAGSYRGFAWNGRRAVLDPAPRYLPGEVVVDDRLFVDETVLPAEDPFVTAVDDALAEADPAAALRSLGVRWVLVERGMPVDEVPRGDLVVDGEHLTLVDLGAPADHRRPTPEEGAVLLVVLANALVAGVTGVSFLSLARNAAGR